MLPPFSSRSTFSMHWKQKWRAVIFEVNKIYCYQIISIISFYGALVFTYFLGRLRSQFFRLRFVCLTSEDFIDKLVRYRNKGLQDGVIQVTVWRAPIIWPCRNQEMNSYKRIPYRKRNTLYKYIILHISITCTPRYYDQV